LSACWLAALVARAARSVGWRQETVTPPRYLQKAFFVGQVLAWKLSVDAQPSMPWMSWMPWMRSWACP
jgi:hypothetical protein